MQNPSLTTVPTLRALASMCEDQQSSSLLQLTAVNGNQLTQLDVQWKQRLHGC